MKMNPQKAHLWAQNYTTALSELSSIFFVLSLWRFYYPESQKDKKVVAFDGMFRYTRVVTQGANRTELAMFKDSTMAKWYDIVEVVAWVVYAATFVWFLLTDANAAVNANLLAAATWYLLL